jgi:hypothetical protein
MTDIDIREEVTTTTSTVIQALTLPVDPAMFQEVRKFGFEYEMLPSGTRDNYSNSPGLDAHMAEWWDEEYERDGYCCDECSESRANEERRLYRRTHGLGSSRENPSGGPYDLIQRAHDASLIADNARCDYHCQCENCAHDRSYPLLTAQADGSCGVEFVSRIIDCNEFDNGDAAWEIGRWVDLMNGWKDEGLWMPDGITSNGNHVHVESNGREMQWCETALQRSAFRHIDALYAAFDWRRVADGGCGQIRGYNSKPATHGAGGSWLSDRGYGTFEHRLWNTPSDPERLWAHIGISIGIQRWAFNIAANMPGFKFWDESNRGRYGYIELAIPDETYQALTDNVGEVVRGIRAYIPRYDQFTIARDLIVNITPVT